jgi:hypothetical protein
MDWIVAKPGKLHQYQRRRLAGSKKGGVYVSERKEKRETIITP